MDPVKDVPRPDRGTSSEKDTLTIHPVEDGTKNLRCRDNLGMYLSSRLLPTTPSVIRVAANTEAIKILIGLTR